MQRRFKKLETSRQLNQLMKRHYGRARYERLTKPLAYVTSGAPVEILRAMGFSVAYPENYAALCGARKVAVDLCQVAESHGYSQDLCSYARAHLGSVFEPMSAPMKGLPRPALLLCCNNICGTVLKWFQAVASTYDVPLFVIDTPFVHQQLEDHTVAYVAAQLEDLIKLLEKRFHRRFSDRKLRNVLALSNETVRLWRQIRQMCKARPSPLNAPDLFVNMAPIVVLRGTRAAVDFYRALRDEVRDRVESGIGAIPCERHRLLWDNIAVWYRLYRFFRHFVDQDACFVVDTYTGAWSAEVDGGEPLEDLARAYSTILLNSGFGQRAQQMIGLIREYEVDGFVMHSNRSCKPYSLGQYEVKRIVSDRTGVPGLVIEADMCDSRAYADAPIKTRIQAFMEMLGSV